MGQITQSTRFFSLCYSLFLLSACTDSDDSASKKREPPWVMELHVIPTKITINPDKFYSKPFTVRAKYSNATVTNVTNNIQWVSENLNLLDVNKKGELIATGNCKSEKCKVFLVGTDAESGKSVRVTVNIKPKVVSELEQAKKKA